MKVYKPKYKYKGKLKKCQHWHIGFTDNKQIRRRLPAFTNKRVTEQAADKIQDLLSGVIDQAWLEQLPAKMRDKLIVFGLVDNRRLSQNIGKSLTEHLIDFHRGLTAAGCSRRYADQVKERIGFIFTDCGFKTWTDIDANMVLTFLDDLRTKKGIGQRSFNYYLKACKRFCRWMIKERRASAPNPLDHLSYIKQTEFRNKRRALTLPEQFKLLEATEAAPSRFNMTGHERALVYCLALETGLRANEIRSLTVSAFNFAKDTVTVQAGFTKNKETAIMDLKHSTAARFKTFLTGKLPNVKIFAMPTSTAKMIRKDLEAAQIPYKTDDGQVDFHGLRHSFITNLTRQGVHPKDAQVLARHSTITLTMDFYTHVKRESLRKIIEAQPDLTKRKKETG